MSSQIFAKHVLPVFAGFWYTKVKFNYMDSCLQNKYNYDVKLYGDAKTVASTLLKDVPLHSDCQWNDPILERELSSKPDDFVSLEEQEDWDVILQEHLGPQPQSWYRVCLNNEGYQKDRVSVVIQPSY